MEITCKNCDHNYQGNYCNNCGQSAQTHAINYHYIWHDIQHGVFHVDKGLFYTLSQLFTRPGAAIREFIEGKRVKHFKPVAMIFLMGTVYGILYHYLNIKIAYVHATGSKEAVEMGNGINEWIGTHYAFVMLVSIPLFALGSYISFRRKRYNFVEHAVLNCFVGAQKMVLQFAALPLLYYFGDSPRMNMIYGIIFIADFVLTYWVYRTFFPEYSKAGSFLRTLLSYVLFFIFITVVAFAVTLVAVKLRY